MNLAHTTDTTNEFFCLENGDRFIIKSWFMDEGRVILEVVTLKGSSGILLSPCTISDWLFDKKIKLGKTVIEKGNTSQKYKIVK